MWVWEGQPVNYRIAAVCHLCDIIDDEDAELKLTKPGFTSFQFPARRFVKGARYKTTIRSFRDFVSAPPYNAPECLDEEVEWVCGLLCTLGLDSTDVYAPMEAAQAEFTLYTKDSMGVSPGFFGTDFDEALDGVGGLVGISDEALGNDLSGVDVWDVSSLYPAIASCMPLPTGDAECDYSIDSLDELPTDGLWLANVILPDGTSHFVTSVEYPHIADETTDYSQLSRRRLRDADVQCVYFYSSVTGLYRDVVDKWYAEKMNSEGIVKEYHKKKMNSFFGSLALRYSKDKEVAVYRDGYGFDVEVVGRVDHQPGSLFLHQVFIVAYGRAVLSKALADYADHVVYYDTDSVHLVGIDPPDVRLEGVPVGDRDDDLGKWTLRDENVTARYFGLRRYAIRDGDYAILHTAGYRAPAFLQRGDWNRIEWSALDRQGAVPSSVYIPGVDSLETHYTKYRLKQLVFPHDLSKFDRASIHVGGEGITCKATPDVLVCDHRPHFESFAPLPADEALIRRRRLRLCERAFT